MYLCKGSYYRGKEGVQSNWNTRIWLLIFEEEEGGVARKGIYGYTYLKYII